MINLNVNKVIELIYEAAIEPEKWTDLLNSLAEFVDYVEKQSGATDSYHEMLSVVPKMIDIHNKKSSITISETLKSLTNIDDEQYEVERIGVGQANDLLIGHFVRAIKIAKRLVDIDEQHEVVLSILDRLPIALVLVDVRAQIIESNALADEILLSGSGLVIENGFLRSPSNGVKLLKAVSMMSKHDPATSRGQTLLLTNSAAENSLMLFLAPLKHHDIEQVASVAIFISQRRSQPVSLPKELSELYGLTDKELQITSQLVCGLSVKEISCESGTSEHTVRSQVKSVLKKTDTTRQAELVSLIYNGMGAFVNSIPTVKAGKREGLLTKAKPWQSDHETLQLNDGRNLAYQEYGDPDGEPVIHCHSVLGSRLEFALNGHEIARQKSVRVIIADRPGFGASDPDSKMSYMKWVDDLVELVDHLGLETFSISGYAMGGIYALACAEKIPERLKKVVLISAGMPAKSSADFEKIIPLYKMNIRLARYLPKVYKLLSDVLVKGIINDPASFFSQLSEKMDRADQVLMDSNEFKTEILASLQEGFRQGGKASSLEIIQLMHDWGFKPENITTPVDLWHGDSDHHVPQVLSQRFEEHIKNTNYFIKKDQGHYMFYTHWEDILDQLLS